jgi:hypothetical protein
MTATVIRWQNTRQKCEGWRSSLMDFKYDMSNDWTTEMKRSSSMDCFLQSTNSDKRHH